MSETACKNTDRELWREKADDYYSPSIHVTERGGIGINVGGLVKVRTLREWHDADRMAEIFHELQNALKSDLESDSAGVVVDALLTKIEEFK